MEDNDDLWIVFLILCAYSMCHVYYVTIDSLFTWFISLSSIVLLVTLFISLNQMICYGVHKNVFLCHEPIITVITTELWTLHRTKCNLNVNSQYTWLYDLQIYRKTQYTSLKKPTRSRSTHWCLTIRKYSSCVAAYNNIWCHGLLGLKHE